MTQVQDTLLNSVYFSRFPRSSKGHGGTRRAFQMMHVIRKYNPRLVSAALDDFGGEPLNLPPRENGRQFPDDSELRMAVTGGEYFLWSDQYREAVFHLRTFAHKWAGIINTKLPVDVAFVDDPFYFSPLVAKLCECNVPVIGFEQNIETLVKGQVDERHRHELFEKEIETFRKCALVITISHEDTSLLNNFDVNTLLLPYDPGKEERDFFLQIRQSRVPARDRQGFVMLGTAHNIPTFDGMVKLAGDWAEAKELQNETLYIAGYGTEQIGNLSHLALAQNIKVLGGVEDHVLCELLEQAKAAVIFQTNATGALTRIRELLIAGVPVYANHDAARTYHHVPGVTEFQDFIDLKNILARNECTACAMHVPVPEPHPDNFLLKAIDGIVDQKTSGMNHMRCPSGPVPGERMLNLEKELNSKTKRIAELEKQRENLIDEYEERIRCFYAGYTFRAGNALLWPAKKILARWKVR